ncbi:MAG: HlyD family efflux transporter periplasmic adaptor subunit [Planctomycetes bacterium]|nr:HlyD family efflux transporter periplasmic adaptor subunit [Planctomycetota bacterium]
MTPMNTTARLRLLTLAALFAACGGETTGAPTQDPDLFTVKKDDLPITVRENAELQALRETIVRSEVEGQTTIIFIVPEGTQVKQGEKLVELDVSELVEKRANQGISVGKAEAALVQARKELEILQKQLTTNLNTAASNLRIAELDLEKLLGRKSDGGEGTNGDMIARLLSLVNPPAAEPAAVATGKGAEIPPIPAHIAATQVDPRSYAGLVERVYELLAIEGDRDAAAARDMGEIGNKILAQADAIRVAMSELKVKEDTYGYSRRLAERQFITRTQLDSDQLSFQSQMSKVSLAWNDLDLLINYTLAKDRIKLTQDRDNAALELERVKGANGAAEIKSTSDLESKRLEFELAKERLDALDRQIKSAVVYAPTPGTVVYARIDRNRGGGEAVREGVQVRQRQELIILPDTTTMRCLIKVQEAQVDKVMRGQVAVVTVEAFQGEQFTGRVTNVAPVADSNSGWMTSDRKVYTTIVDLDSDNPDGRLRSRMAANVTIMVDVVKDTLPVPLQAVYRDRSVNYVWKMVPTGPVAMPVKCGRQNSERVEILEGVAAGDVLRLKAPTGVPTPKFEQPVAPQAAPTKADDGPRTDGQAAAAAGGGQRANRMGMGTRKKFAEMTPEELQQAKERLDGMPAMIDGFRDRMEEAKVKELEDAIAAVRRALDDNDLAAAQTQQDKISAAIRNMMGGRSSGGGAGGGGRPNGGN